MNWSWLTMFVNTSKVAGYTRAGIGALFAAAIAKWPFLHQYLDPTTQAAFATAISGVAVGIWSHFAKAIQEAATPSPLAGAGGAGGSVRVDSKGEKK